MSDAPFLPYCDDVGPECPVEGSIYGYAPSLHMNAFAGLVFAICMVGQLGMGMYKKTWSYLLAVGGGCALELLGSLGLIAMHFNPYSHTGFQAAVICLTIAPAFLAAGIYLNLKHLVLIFGPQFSVLRPPSLYTWVFVASDVLSIACQAVGSGMAAKQDPKIMWDAVRIIKGGMAFQITTLGMFAGCAAWYFVRVVMHRRELNPGTKALRQRWMFRLFLGSMSLAYVAILTRCAFRMAEFDDGWRSKIMTNETFFIALDTVPCLIAVVAQTVLHPGYCLRMPKVDYEDGLVGTSVGTEMDSYHYYPKV
ncbi:sphingoid long-chain base transporter RSB1 [Phyllosticta citribraziliensis]